MAAVIMSAWPKCWPRCTAAPVNGSPTLPYTVASGPPRTSSTVTYYWQRPDFSPVVKSAPPKGKNPADLHSAQGRQSALGMFCRVGGAAHLHTMASSRAWQTWLAIWAITVSTPTLDDDIERGPAIAKRHELAVLEFSRVLAALLPRVGHRMKPPFTLEQLSMTVYALSEGLVLHHRFAPQTVVSVELPTLAGGAPETWSLFSVALQALLDGFTELDS